MKKIIFLLSVCLVVPISSQAVVGGSHQSVTAQRSMTVEQIRGNDNTTIANRAECDKYCINRQKIETAKLTLKQTDANNSKIIMNQAKGGVAWQDVNAKKLKITQKGGKSSTIILNDYKSTDK